jgi:hypothetical protein
VVMQQAVGSGGAQQHPGDTGAGGQHHHRSAARCDGIKKKPKASICVRSEAGWQTRWSNGGSTFFRGGDEVEQIGAVGEEEAAARRAGVGWRSRRSGAM